MKLKSDFKYWALTVIAWFTFNKKYLVVEINTKPKLAYFGEFDKMIVLLYIYNDSDFYSLWVGDIGCHSIVYSSISWSIKAKQ